MKKTNFAKIALFLAGALILSFCSCASVINGAVSDNGSAALLAYSAMQPRTAVLISAIKSASGQNDGLIIDGAAIERSMQSAPGVSSVSITNLSPSTVDCIISISNINDFLSSVEGRNFIEFDRSNKRCLININRGNGAEILALLSPDIINYLNALMAPVSTGENMRKQEYLELIEMFYNKAISDEIAGSLIQVSVEFPGAITQVTGGTYSGRTANFNIPLADLLVLETPLFYEVKWN